VIRKSGNAADATHNLSNIVQEGVGAIRPTGQHTEARSDDYARPSQSHSAIPDLVVGVAAGFAVIAEAVRAMRERVRKKKEHGGNE
jgi:hypothetical protein